MGDLWTEKYRPKKISDIIGNEDNISTIVKWITDFKNNVKGTPKVLLISGEPGIGKTSTAHVILNEYGYDIIEHNASDIRGKKSMDIIVKRSLEYTNIMDLMSGCAKPVAIILDEIDNLFYH
jgi:DNA polymerase III delta prime subunit